jgi:hypothetical protein
VCVFAHTFVREITETDTEESVRFSEVRVKRKRDRRESELIIFTVVKRTAVCKGGLLPKNLTTSWDSDLVNTM